MTKISIYSQKCSQRGCNEKRGVEAYLSQIKAAAEHAKEHGSDLLILPGHSLGNVEVEGNSDCKKEIEGGKYIDDGKQLLQNIADTLNIAMLGEVCRTYLFLPHQELSNAMKQTVYRGAHRTSKKECHRVSEFEQALSSGNRSFNLGDLRVITMLCGEQNILRVPRTFIPEFPENFSWKWDYDLLLNPTHDSMGQWNIINPRLRLLSKDNRVVIHTANNLNHSWGTAIRVYRNGEMILDGNFDKRVDLDKHIEDDDNWRLVTIRV